jgi:hypothetical protein
MLEAKIEALTEQVAQLTDAVTALKNVLLNGVNTVPPAEQCALGDGRQTPVVKVEDIPNVSPTTTATSPTSEPESKPVSYSDVSKLVTEIAKKDLAKAKAALARLGVKHGKELTEAQWPEAVAYLTRVAVGGVEPEASHA